jgi:hypothetical protein
VTTTAEKIFGLNPAGNALITGLRLYGAATTINETSVSSAAWKVVLEISSLGNSSRALLGWLANLYDSSVSGMVLENIIDSSLIIYEADARGHWSKLTELSRADKGNYVPGVSSARKSLVLRKL